MQASVMYDEQKRTLNGNGSVTFQTLTPIEKVRGPSTEEKSSWRFPKTV